MGLEGYLLISSIVLFMMAIVLTIGQYRERLPISPELSRMKIKALRKERRNHPRYKTSLRVKYRTVDEEKISWVKDISKGGIRLFLDNPFSIGTFLEIEINLPYDSRPIFTRGNIVWIHKRKSDAGLSFHQAEQSDLNRVLQYIGYRNQIATLSK